LGGCETGEAKATKGYRLKAWHVIHTVGPVWKGGGAGERELLAACYENALRLAAELGCHSVAFPAISTGVYGYPADAAAEIALGTVARVLEVVPELEEVRLVAFNEAAERCLRDAAERLGIECA
jgi:O-acetyl-ADP-ribose deacetylase (regulator of RNase III)